MRSPVRRLVQAATALAGAAALALTGAGAAHAAALPPEELRRVTDTYLYDISLTEFIDVRDQAPYADQLDWSSDSCSWSPDQPIGYDFDPGCKRHDFGYRNYELQSRFTEDNRLRIDDNFRDDLYGICDGDWLCRGVADIYYAAVRQFGGSGVQTAEALRAAGAHQQAEELVAVHDELRAADTQAEANALIAAFEAENDVDLTQRYPVAG
ncbi:phospholipase [Streptomonospora sp. S1-112]|uniref:Phospholipase n=1 Tax=Streptomonospora mangrovi TaxID=2883123 RepID=A0A9X3SK32_9ACTN|nr:phospholipase [Streptomonospora mangrovi]MDA0562766.1 phospholipase [Streptomonospora mangrovi]